MHTLPALALTVVAPLSVALATGTGTLSTSGRLIAAAVALVALLVAARGVPTAQAGSAS